MKRERVYLVLSGIFITNALLGEIIGGKLFQFGPFTMSLGVIAWPVVFLTSDLVNEYFGRAGVRTLSLFTAMLIAYVFVVMLLGMRIPATSFSPVNDENFRTVFGQSMWITIGSLVAFLLSQAIDVFVFWLVRARTDGRHLWLRATGSTAVSQLFDTFVVLGIAFYIPGQLGYLPSAQVMSLEQFLTLCGSNYIFKLAVAILLTPLIYVGHSLVDRWLGEEESKALMESAAKHSLHD